MLSQLPKSPGTAVRDCTCCCCSAHPSSSCPRQHTTTRPGDPLRNHHLGTLCCVARCCQWPCTQSGLQIKSSVITLARYSAKLCVPTKGGAVPCSCLERMRSPKASSSAYAPSCTKCNTPASRVGLTVVKCSTRQINKTRFTHFTVCKDRDQHSQVTTSPRLAHAAGFIQLLRCIQCNSMLASCWVNEIQMLPTGVSVCADIKHSRQQAAVPTSNIAGNRLAAIKASSLVFIKVLIKVCLQTCQPG